MEARIIKKPVNHLDLICLFAARGPEIKESELKYPIFRTGQDGILVTGEDYSATLYNSPIANINDILMVTEGGQTSRYHIQFEYGANFNKLIEDLHFYFVSEKTQFQLLRNCRFKVNVSERIFLSKGRKIAEGDMTSSPDNWQGKFFGSQWAKDLGEDFKLFLTSHFDLRWAHKVVCQQRGKYQFLPHVALFFHNKSTLVMKLINRPIEKDSCEGFYVGKLFGKAFGYHLEGENNEFPEADNLFKGALRDILHREIEDDELITERFAVDVFYDRVEDRWILNSTTGEIGRLIKGVTPDNTCDIRKHVTWTYNVFGENIKDVPLLENLLIEGFHRSFQRIGHLVK